MKVAIFWNDMEDIEDLEEEMNKWFKGHPKVKVINTNVACDSDSHYVVFIFYE